MSETKKEKPTEGEFMKQFFPNTDYNKAKRKKYFILLALGIVLLGGTAVTFFILKQTMIALMVLVFAVVALTTLPSALSSYPVKREPLIEVDGTKVRLYNGKAEVKASEILAVSVLIDVPKIKSLSTKDEKAQYLRECASKKPTEPITGACDITVKDAKGKDETKYNIVEDCVGALEALLGAGAKKYRLVYCLDKLSVAATYPLNGNSSDGNALKELSEKDRMMQLL